MEGGSREELLPKHESVLAELWCSNVQPWLRNTVLLKEQTWFLLFLPPTTAHFSSELLLSPLPRAPESEILPAGVLGTLSLDFVRSFLPLCEVLPATHSTTCTETFWEWKRMGGGYQQGRQQVLTKPGEQSCSVSTHTVWYFYDRKVFCLNPQKSPFHTRVPG